eukprot:TRINITY_DN54655_c0_g1_i1.p1 TRINITY_DN54655_c0_g1~~TRINITY_DN54655_c0_g1_i1.p1  ORF type:complete len:972 (-),score=135.87 TRINITY_DN54655_c0_g1_i1:152-3067(-)
MPHAYQRLCRILYDGANLAASVSVAAAADVKGVARAKRFALHVLAAPVVTRAHRWLRGAIGVVEVPATTPECGWLSAFWLRRVVLLVMLLPLWCVNPAVGEAISAKGGVDDVDGEPDFALLLDDSAPSHDRNVKAIKALQAGNVDEALQLLRKALRVHPRSAAIQNTLGVALMATSRLQGSWSRRAVVQEAATQAFQRAQALSDGDDVEIGLNEALASRHLNASQTNRIGYELAQQQRWAEAVMHFSDALDVVPSTDPYVFDQLAVALFENATKNSRSWREAEPLFLRAKSFFSEALRLQPTSIHAKRKYKEVVHVLQRMEDWRKGAVREMPAPAALLRSVAVNGTVVCTFSGGSGEFPEMVLNLLASIQRHAPLWASAFVVLSMDAKAEAFFQRHKITTWLSETDDIYSMRWLFLVGVLKAGLDVLLVDADVVFLSDPFSHFHFDADLEVMTDHFFPARDLWDPRWKDEEHINLGFVFARSQGLSIQLIQDFFISHHVQWHDDAGAQNTHLDGAMIGLDLWDQRVFSRYVRRRIENGTVVSFYENLTYGDVFSDSDRQTSKSDLELPPEHVRNPSIRVLDPRVIAHGGNFFWRRAHRTVGLESPSVVHANFGKHKLYFMRDRGVWFREDFTARFLALPERDAEIPPAELPNGFFMLGEADPFSGGALASSFPRFLQYSGRATGNTSAGLADAFVELCAALEVAVALGRRLVLPADLDCQHLPMYEAYQLGETLGAGGRRANCTIDYFLDSDRFVKRFGRFFVEAGIVHSTFFRGLKSAPALLGRRLRSLPDILQPSVGNLATLGSFRVARSARGMDATDDGLPPWPDIIEVGVQIRGDGDDGGAEFEDILEIRDLVRRKLGSASLSRALWSCTWIEFEPWHYARRPGQTPPQGQRACGVEGLDCCGVYHGWADKLEYFTGIPWDLPCNCGVGLEFGCAAGEGGQCLREGEPHIQSSFEFGEDLRRVFGKR